MTIRGTSVLATVLLGLLPLAQTAQGDTVIYDNGVPDLATAWASDFDLPSQMADDFVLQPGANTITDVHWWGLYASNIDPWPLLDTFTLRFYEDAGGGPAVVPFYDVPIGPVVRTNGGREIVGYTLYEYGVQIPELTLNAGTTYYLSIVNNTQGLADDWFWAQSAGTGADWHRVSDGASWTPLSTELAFNLTGPSSNVRGVVPEPASLTLLGIGIAGLALRRNRKR